KLVPFKKKGRNEKKEETVVHLLKDKEEVKDKGKTCDPVVINTRMSPRHLKDVLKSFTPQQVKVLEEMGLGDYHNNFDFISTPGKLGLWIVKNFDPETDTIRMLDGRKIKVTRELIHEILGVPMGTPRSDRSHKYHNQR
ncbi:hypothetical protein Tco_0787517, partial [Tanacetum coccineum]